MLVIASRLTPMELFTVGVPVPIFKLAKHRQGKVQCSANALLSPIDSTRYSNKAFKWLRWHVE